jgi:hypothetical protein
MIALLEIRESARKEGAHGGDTDRSGSDRGQRRKAPQALLSKFGADDIEAAALLLRVVSKAHDQAEPINERDAELQGRFSVDDPIPGKGKGKGKTKAVTRPIPPVTQQAPAKKAAGQKRQRSQGSSSSGGGSSSGGSSSSGGGSSSGGRSSGTGEEGVGAEDPAEEAAVAVDRSSARYQTCTETVVRMMSETHGDNEVRVEELIARLNEEGGGAAKTFGRSEVGSILTDLETISNVKYRNGLISQI